MTLALMLINELPSQHIIDLRFYNLIPAGVMLTSLLLGLSLTIIHIIKEVRHV